MERLLTDRGYALRVAADGVQALQLMEECKPDLVLSDVRMPGMDGIELLQKVQMQFPRLWVQMQFPDSPIGQTAGIGSSVRRSKASCNCH
jgi:CheY-like chemotaxis protein